MPTLPELNHMAHSQAEIEFLTCCGSRKWAELMLQARPFIDEMMLFRKAEDIWKKLSREDWLEAFSHHPRIGAKLDSQHKNRASDRRAEWSAKEQGAMAQASQDTAQALREQNEVYFKKFRFNFIVCATGKSGDQMLDLLKQRLNNDPQSELLIAAKEQSKITRIRLEKLLNS